MQAEELLSFDAEVRQKGAGMPSVLGEDVARAAQGVERTLSDVAQVPDGRTDDVQSTRHGVANALFLAWVVGVVRGRSRPFASSVGSARLG